MHQLIKIKNNKGQTVVETAFTIIMVVFVLCFILQLLLYALFKIAISESVYESMKVAKQSGNPKLVDDRLASDLGWIEIGGRKIFSSDFAVKYYIGSTPNGFGPEYAPFGFGFRYWPQFGIVGPYTLTESNGYFKIKVTYEMPVRLLPFNILTTIEEERVSKLDCNPIFGSTYYPFCYK